MATAGAETIVLGCVSLGKPSPKTADHPLASDAACEELLAEFLRLGGQEVDTSRVYQNGQCEAVIGRCPSGKQLRIATKFSPGARGKADWNGEGPREQLDKSLAALNASSVPIYYIHTPDSSEKYPLEDTLNELGECHKEGKFQEFGLSNFPAWQVVEITQYMKNRNYCLPTVYQGVYNALNRTSEQELVPVLRNYGIKYYSHGSIASGFLTGKYQKGVAPVKGVDRFAQSRRVEQYKRRYLDRDEMFESLQLVTDAAKAANISNLEAAVRWTQHHSAVDASKGDKVLIGVSRLAQIGPVMAAAKVGPLPKPLVDAFEEVGGLLGAKSEYYLQFPYPKEGVWRARARI